MEDQDERFPQVYTLTPLTRASGQSRRVVIAGFDMHLRGVIVTIASVLASVIPVSILWQLVGSWSLSVTVLFIATAFYLVEARSQKGLHLRMYQSIIDKKRENIGKFTCCGVQVDPAPQRVGTIIPSSVPVHSTERSSVIDDVLMTDYSTAEDRSAPSIVTAPEPGIDRRDEKRRTRKSSDEASHSVAPVDAPRRKKKGRKRREKISEDPFSGLSSENAVGVGQ